MRALLILLFLIACDPEPEPTPVAPPPVPEVEVMEPEPDDEGEEAVTPVYDDAALDEMEERDLEAACFEGSTAACDRLGH